MIWLNKKASWSQNERKLWISLRESKLFSRTCLNMFELKAFCFSPWIHFKFAHWNSVLCRPQRPDNSFPVKKAENASKYFALFSISKFLKFFRQISFSCILYYESLINKKMNSLIHKKLSTYWNDILIIQKFMSFDFWLQY